MTTSRARDRSGLTLLELLAAVAILSAVAAAFASIARDASGALREAASMRADDDAWGALHLLEAALGEDAFHDVLTELAALANERGAQVEREWRFAVDDTQAWRVHAFAPAPDSTPGLPSVDAEATPWAQRVGVVRLEVMRDNASFNSSPNRLAIERLVAFPNANGSPSANGGAR